MGDFSKGNEVSDETYISVHRCSREAAYKS